jgi:hypothetical protein
MVQAQRKCYNDVKALGETDWKNLASNRQIWQNFLRKAMAQKWAVFPMIMNQTNVTIFPEELSTQCL